MRRTRSGSGIHPFRDPALRDEFDAPRLDIDISEPARLRGGLAGGAGRVRRRRSSRSGRVEQAPAYPMQMMIAVFDFPEKDPAGRHAEHVPELAVDWIRGS